MKRKNHKVYKPKTPNQMNGNFVGKTYQRRGGIFDSPTRSTGVPSRNFTEQASKFSVKHPRNILNVSQQESSLNMLNSNKSYERLFPELKGAKMDSRQTSSKNSIRVKTH